MTPSLPVPTPPTTTETAPYWDALSTGHMVLPQCKNCHKYVWYPRSFCPSCKSSELSWDEVSGVGTVYSFTVVRRGAPPEFIHHLPYVVALVELDEGPRLYTNLVNVDPAAVAIGQRVNVVFDQSESGRTIPRFQPLNGER